ncbi:MAG: efflux transporter outer membrane subunit [Nitrospirae bacterium]|nr:MAG: efflux transporter outer membrane subunit [Nitrospirota bacterium]
MKHDSAGVRSCWHRLIACIQASGWVAFVLVLSACSRDWLPHVDLAPPYQPPQYVVPASWHGASPFVEAHPSDDALRPDWWKLYGDPVLNRLIDQAMEANPDLQAAAERFIQARAVMMKVRSGRIPQLELGFDVSRNRQSEHRLFRGVGEATEETSLIASGLASWEPDFWSAIRNATRAEIYRAQERAADWGLARLSLQAELAMDYFTLRGLDAQIAVLSDSIALYQRSLKLVQTQFSGGLASSLDVARVESLLFSTQTKLAQAQGQRQVTEQAIAILVNQAPASFTIEPVKHLSLAHFTIPQTLPSTLLERRPDVAAMERRMAQANREIGIARAAFFPDVSFRLGGGFEDEGINLTKLANSFWSVGSLVSLPIFQGGFRRAQLQQAWSVYREMEDRYRSVVLNAFREVENALSLTSRLTVAAERQASAVKAFVKTQDLTSELFQGGLASSLELIFAQVGTLEAHLKLIEIQVDLLKASVSLIRALGGGWDQKQLPKDEQIQPFGTLQYVNLTKPPPVGGIDVHADNNRLYNDLTKPVSP